MHRDRRAYSVPRFQPGIDPFIGHHSRNGKMPVYRAPFICSLIHRDTTTCIAGKSAAKTPDPAFFGIAKRRTSSRYHSKGRYLNVYVERIGPLQLNIKAVAAKAG